MKIFVFDLFAASWQVIGGLVQLGINSSILLLGLFALGFAMGAPGSNQVLFYLLLIEASAVIITMADIIVWVSCLLKRSWTRVLGLVLCVFGIALNGTILYFVFPPSLDGYQYDSNKFETNYAIAFAALIINNIILFFYWIISISYRTLSKTNFAAKV